MKTVEPDWAKFIHEETDPEGVRQQKADAFMHAFIDWRLSQPRDTGRVAAPKKRRSRKGRS